MGHHETTSRSLPMNYGWKVVQLSLLAVNSNPMLFWGQDRHAFLFLGGGEYNSCINISAKGAFKQA